MKHSFKTKGTCSAAVEFELDNGIVRNVTFVGGCNGNTTGVGRLCEGLQAEDVIARLKGIRCGFKSTSCPDQLAQAIEKAIEEEKA